MKKVIDFGLFFTLFQIALFIYVKANGVTTNFLYANPYFMIWIYSFLYFLNSWIEYQIISQFYEKVIINAGFIFEINLITYPLAQTVAYITYFFTRAFFNYYIIVIEIIVIIIEFLLVKRKIYRLVKFHYINDSEQIKQIKSKKKILLSVAIANIITFLLGIWISFPIYLYDIKL